MITKRAEYMLQALVDLAQHRSDGYVPSREVAERKDIPAKYMPQLMATLTRKGWVDSVRGAGGGVRLAIDPKDVTVEEVIHLSGDPLLVKSCAVAGTCPKESTCVLHPVWVRAQASLHEALQGTTLADLLS